MSRPTTRKKGNALEDLVAWLHQLEGVAVSTRIKVPALDAEPAREREIDVLVEQEVAGHTVQLVFECKNEQEPIGVGRIDEFVGKLDDIGIPATQGIFVSPIRYTPDAESRARKKGIRLLTLSGLNAERLAAAVNEALLTLVHYVLFVDLQMFDYLPARAAEDFEQWRSSASRLEEGSVLNTLWSEWVTTPAGELGERVRFYRDDEGRAALASLRVVGYVGRLPGTARHASLTNVATKTIERSRVSAEFPIPNTVDLDAIETEEALHHLTPQQRVLSHHLCHRIKVPRLVAANVFWPPTREAVEKVLALKARGERVTFAVVEGRDLSRAWEYFAARRAQGDSAE